MQPGRRTPQSPGVGHSCSENVPTSEAQLGAPEPGTPPATHVRAELGQARGS